MVHTDQNHCRTCSVLPDLKLSPWLSMLKRSVPARRRTEGKANEQEQHGSILHVSCVTLAPFLDDTVIFCWTTTWPCQSLTLAIHVLTPPLASSASRTTETQGPLNGGGFKRGGFPIWTCPSFFLLFCPFLSFLGLSRFFWDFPDLSGDGPGIFPICPFPLSRPIKSTYEEQSRKGPRHNLDLSRK